MALWYEAAKDFDALLAELSALWRKRVLPVIAGAAVLALGACAIIIGR